MKVIRIIACVFIAVFAFTSLSTAGDFDWMKDFSIKAEADSSGFRARLSTRFRIGETEINAAIGSTDNFADAYMVLRLGEMSGKSTEEVINKYKTQKGQGWGALAKSLGIKPGSKEFKALKNGDDLYEKGSGSDAKGKSKGKGKKKK
jgi:hypothetical protein